MQFRATFKVRHTEDMFLLKTILQLRRDYDLELFATIIDLDKAHNSIKYEIILIALNKIGVLDRFI